MFIDKTNVTLRRRMHPDEKNYGSCGAHGMI